MTKEREGLIEVLGFLSAQSQELHDVSTTEEQLELHYDMELNKTRLDNDVLRARGRELTDPDCVFAGPAAPKISRVYTFRYPTFSLSFRCGSKHKI